MARPKVHDEALRNRLLDRALERVCADGVPALRLRSLAAECGTSTTAVYSLFGGKAGLLTALFDEALRQFRAYLAVTPGGDSLDDLVRLALAYRRGALAQPHLFEVVFDRNTPGLASDAALAPLREFVERAIEEDALRPDIDPSTASLVLWATVHGWVSLQLRGLLPPGAETRFEDVLRCVTAGWASAQPT
jgi:AcrR family transcriptional regulator